MDPRQLIRVAAVVVAALALAFLGWRMTGDSGADEIRPGALPGGADASEYADLVVDLQSVLARYAPLQGVADHNGVHAAKLELAGLEPALLDVEERAGAAGAEEVVGLAGTVRTRATDLLDQAAADHTGFAGLAAVQAFGREVALRAWRIGEAVERAPEDGWAAVTDAVSAPWPPPDEEGRDDPVPG